MGQQGLIRRLLPTPLRLWLRSRRAWRAGAPELALLDHICEAGRTFVDAGAHLGLYTHAALARQVRVVAVEPHPRLAQNLRRLFAPDVTVLNLAMSDQTGQTTMYLPVQDGRELDARGALEEAANQGYALQQMEVETTTLDALGLKDVGAIKIDVEGHELAVLRGGQQLLRRDRPSLLVEVEERHHPGGSHAVFRFLEEREYQGYFFWRDALWPLAVFEPERHQARQHAKQPHGSRSPDYAANFLFVWRGNDATLSRLAVRIKA
jgi:FkbM family methyltransferase